MHAKIPDSDPSTTAGPAYDTLSAPGTAETKVQRSRFLAEAHPAADEQEARAFLDGMTKRHHDARHHCFAWRLGHGSNLIEFRSDAGEPSGSAGEPILNALRQADVTDTVAVVARWFGGVKLGTGGLGRAYRQAATEALGQATRKRIYLGTELKLHFPYPLQKTVSHLLEAQCGHTLNEQYDQAVTWTVWLPDHRVDDFTVVVLDAGQGKLTLERLD